MALEVTAVLNKKLSLGIVPRFAFAAASAWIVTVWAYSRTTAPWWPWPVRTAAMVVVVAYCLDTAIRPKLGRSIWAAALLVAWAVTQVLRVQWSDYPWRPLLVASTTYGFVAVLGLVLGVHIATLSGLTCAGRRNVSDDAGAR